MDILAYLITLSNIQAFGGPKSKVQDLSVKIADVGSLAKELMKCPDFDIEGVKRNAISRVNDIVIYPSKNVQQYMIKGNVSPYEEGTVIKIIYKTPGSSSESNGDDNNPINLSYLIGQKGFHEHEIIPFLQQYFNS